MSNLLGAAEMYCRVDRDTNMSLNRVDLLTPLSHSHPLPEVVFLAARPGLRHLLNFPPPWHRHLLPLNSLWPCRCWSPLLSPSTVAVAIASGCHKQWGSTALPFKTTRKSRSKIGAHCESHNESDLLDFLQIVHNRLQIRLERIFSSSAKRNKNRSSGRNRITF